MASPVASFARSRMDDIYRIYGKRRGQSRTIRILAAIFLVSFCYLLTVQTLSTPDGKVASTTSNHKPYAPSAAKSEIKFGKHLVQEPADHKHNTMPATLKSRPDDKNQNTLHFEAGLKHIFATAPDEIHVRELLRAIEGSGKERLRETGVRARAFRALFEPWEALHVVSTDDATYVRDDVLTYLRKANDLSGISTTMTRAEMIRAYENYRYFLTRLSALLFPWTAPYFADHMTLHAHLRNGERGMVLTAGDTQVRYLLTSIRTFRQLGCTLPVEVMYLGEDDLDDDSRSELEALPGVVTRDMKQMINDKGWSLKGWAAKPFAILLSSFREVLFIDADALFLRNPEVLFDDPGYNETGALFFRDRLMFPESKKKWLLQILPKPVTKRVRQSRFWTGESGHMQESGVIVVDKWKHFMALLMVTRMNGPDRDGDKDKGIVGTYDMVYGDKETFWLGWELVGDTGYTFHPGDAGTMGLAYADRGESPKIAATAAHIGKHKMLGALAGSYEMTLLDIAEDEEEGILRPPEEDKEPEPEPEAVEGDEDFLADMELDVEAFDDPSEEEATQEEEENEKAKAADYEDRDPQDIEAEEPEDPAETMPLADIDSSEETESKAEEMSKGEESKVEEESKEEDESKEKTKAKGWTSSKKAIESKKDKNKDTLKENKTSKTKAPSSKKEPISEKDSTEEEESLEDKQSSEDEETLEEQESSEQDEAQEEIETLEDKDTSEKKDASEEKDTSKEKDTAEEKDFSKDKESSNDKDSSKHQDSSKAKDSSKEKDSSEEVQSSEEVEASAEEQSSEEQKSSEGEKLSKDNKPSKGITPSTMKRMWEETDSSEKTKSVDEVESVENTAPTAERKRKRRSLGSTKSAKESRLAVVKASKTAAAKAAAALKNAKQAKADAELEAAVEAEEIEALNGHGLDEYMDLEDDLDVDEDQMAIPIPKGQPVPHPDKMPTNYTICAPQLLHLDREGRPLWFNSWLLDSKVVDPKSTAQVSKFQVYMRERREDGEGTGSWMMQSNNMCLQSDRLYRFSKEEKAALRMILSTANEVGALGSKAHKRAADLDGGGGL